MTSARTPTQQLETLAGFSEFGLLSNQAFSHRTAGPMPSVKLEPAARQGGFSHPVLQARVQHAPGGPGSHLFRATLDGVEVALVALDVFPGSEGVVLYELYVSPDHRRKGVGTAIISAVESYARGLGRVCVKLLPRSLAPHITDQQLARWYERLGYSREEGAWDLLVKRV